MKEIKVKRCPKCGKILLVFKEFSNNGGGLRKGLTRYYCRSCGTFDEEDVIKTITKKILPAELLEEKIRKEMLDLRISDNEVAAYKARRITDEAKSEESSRWF